MDLLDKDFKSATLKYVQRIKEQYENSFSPENINTQKLQNKIHMLLLELKSTIIEMKNSLKEFSRFQQAEDRISKLENKSIDIIQSEELKVKIMKKN